MDYKAEGIRIAKEWRKFCCTDVPDASLDVLAGYIANALEAEGKRWSEMVIAAREARDKADQKVTDGEKRAEEYEDKVPMMLHILRRVKQFGNLEDAAFAKQLVEFFESQNA